jgi:hypothetical protein
MENYLPKTMDFYLPKSMDFSLPFTILKTTIKCSGCNGLGCLILYFLLSPLLNYAKIHTVGGGGLGGLVVEI